MFVTHDHFYGVKRHFTLSAHHPHFWLPRGGSPGSSTMAAWEFVRNAGCQDPRPPTDYKVGEVLPWARYRNPFLTYTLPR